MREAKSRFRGVLQTKNPLFYGSLDEFSCCLHHPSISSEAQDLMFAFGLIVTEDNKMNTVIGLATHFIHHN